MEDDEKDDMNGDMKDDMIEYANDYIRTTYKKLKDLL